MNVWGSYLAFAVLGGNGAEVFLCGENRAIIVLLGPFSSPLVRKNMILLELYIFQHPYHFQVGNFIKPKSRTYAGGPQGTRHHCAVSCVLKSLAHWLSSLQLSEALGFVLFYIPCAKFLVKFNNRNKEKSCLFHVPGNHNPCFNFYCIQR